MASSRNLLGLAILAVLSACGKPAPGVARGKVLFYGCLSCHMEDGSGNAAVGAPAIAGLPKWYIEAQLHKFKSGYRAWLPGDTNGLKMRPMTLTLVDDADVTSVAQYIASMPPVAHPVATVSGDATAGKATFAVCGSCHGPDGKGNEAVHGPPLITTGDWYLAGQLTKFKSGLRGTHPADQTGATMRAVTGVLTDQTAINNVVAYIDTLH